MSSPRARYINGSNRTKLTRLKDNDPITFRIDRAIPRIPDHPHAHQELVHPGEEVHDGGMTQYGRCDPDLTAVVLDDGRSRVKREFSLVGISPS